MPTRHGLLVLALLLVPSLVAAQPAAGTPSDAPVAEASRSRCDEFDNPVRWHAPHLPRQRPRLLLERACLTRIEARLARREPPGLVPLGAVMLALGGAALVGSGIVLGTAAGFDETFGTDHASARTSGGAVAGIGAGLFLVAAIVLLVGLENDERRSRTLVARRRRRIERALVQLALSPDGAALMVEGSY